MCKNKENIKFLKVLNGDFISPYNYTYEEVKSAFSKTTYSSMIKKEQLIYNKFFKDCLPIVTLPLNHTSLNGIIHL